jgi:hypothetical protein
LSHGYDGFRIVSAVTPPASERATELPINYGLSGKPELTATIQLLKNPIEPAPPYVFDAATLKATLEPLVKGPLCDGNVCPHVHRYLTPIIH